MATKKLIEVALPLEKSMRNQRGKSRYVMVIPLPCICGGPDGLWRQPVRSSGQVW